MSNYSTESIKTLDYFEHIRQYPGMYIGSKDINGLHHCIKEIVSNSIDEFLNGAGDKIIVKLQKDGGIYIEDNGRGIPHGEHSSGCSVLQACFGVANTGGKFDNATGQTGYNTSGGEHGTGGKAVNALSTKMIVTTSRDGVWECVEFSKGVYQNSGTKNIDKNKTGVSVLFYPDDTIFETVKVDSKKLETMIQEFSFLCSGLTFQFIDEVNNVDKKFFSKDGLYDYINYLNSNKDFIIKPIYFSEKEEKFQVEIAIGYNTSHSNNIRVYTNNIPQEKGTHLTGFKTAFTKIFNDFAKEKKWLKDKDENFAGSDLEEGQIVIINFKMIDPVFKGQNKEELSSSEGRTYVQKLTSQALKEYFSANEKEIKVLFDKALNARKAREAAKKARDAVRKPKEKGFKAKMAISDKFIDCSNKNPTERNLLLVEGQSAATSAIEARNAQTDCIYQLRGKIISCLKRSTADILKNTEIRDIIQILGGGFGNEEFDVSKVGFNKVVITSDQDSDGAAIELLLITFFYTYMRPLIEAGKLYRAVTPLYIVSTKNENIHFYTDVEYRKWVEEHKGIKYETLRAKGLGELDPEQLHEVCFKNQKFKRITISDAEATTELLEILEGKAVEPRKKYVYDNATALGFTVD